MSHADLVALAASAPSSSRTTNTTTTTTKYAYPKSNSRGDVVVAMDSAVAAAVVVVGKSSSLCVTRNNNIPNKNNSNDYFSATMSTAIASPTAEDEASIERRKTAAAAARKRRQRKINLSRRQQQLNSPRFASKNRVLLGIPSSEGTEISTTNDGSQQQQQPVNNNNNSQCAAARDVDSVRPSPPSSSTTTNLPAATCNTKSIRANVEGMTEVAKRWRNQEVVAIPTECSYEACISLQASSSSNSSTKEGHMMTVTPPDWAYRIECARKAAMGHSSSPPITALSSTAPYCWVPRTGECALLQDCFPNRAYAIKDTNGKAQLAHRFNETSEVIQRIARQVWPGPVTLHVAVPCHHSTNNSSDHFLRSFWSTLASNYQHHHHDDDAEEAVGFQPFSGPYLSLRCPRHPLAIKALQKHMDNTTTKGEEEEGPEENGAAQTSRATAFRDLSVLVAFPIVKDNVSSVAADGSTSTTSSNNYCCSAKDVQNRYLSSGGGNCVIHPTPATVSAVLDGEDTSELFAVPTCEHRGPWHTQIWIHGPSRTVTLVQNGAVSASHAMGTVTTNKHTSNNNIHSGCNIMGSPLRGSGSSNSNNNNAALTLGSPVRVDGTTDTSQARIKSAIRQRILNRPPLSKAKQQIMQAVLCQWKVVEEEIVSEMTTL